MKYKVLVTRRIPDAGLALLKETCDVDVWPDALPIPRETLLKKCAEMDGVLSLLTEAINAELLDQSPNLKVVSNYAVGFNNIDVATCTARGIPVGTTPGVLTDTTADFAFALLMAAARRVMEGMDYVRNGQWQTWGPQTLMGQDVHGATLGIVGFGRIGQAMARRGLGFDMRVIYFDPMLKDADSPLAGASPVSMDTLLAESDFISLHVPLTEATHHLISTAQLAAMKQTAILINTARGPVVDPKALYTALRSGRITAAGLDVTDPEPITMDDPLLTLPNCIIAPHIASSSMHTRDQMAIIAAKNLLAGLKGETLPHCVNSEVYD